MNLPPKRSRSQSLLFPAFALILLATGALWFFFNRTTPQPPPQSPAMDAGVETGPKSLVSPKVTEPSVSAPLPGEEGVPGASGSGEGEVASTPSPTLPTKEQLPLAVERINAFYQYLDQQEYIRAHHLDTPSHIYLTSLIQKIVDSPPVVSRETDDLYTILKNSAHFFRILGKDNILLIKQILDREKEKIEEMAADYYLLSEHPDSLGKELSLKVPEGARYEYACFFLNTMGGKLYLSRRDSLTRMVVTYYAILTIHQANVAGKNRYGLPLQPAIDMLTAEIEIGGNRLHYKDAYLDTLYDLKEKYQ